MRNWRSSTIPTYRTCSHPSATHVTRKGRFHSTKKMDSLRIKDRRHFYRYSQNHGGDAIAFLVRFHDMSYVTACQHLKSSGDEYMVKPFHVELLLDRTEALRRVQMERRNAPKRFSFGGIQIDTVMQRAFVSGEDALLKPRKFALLMLLVNNFGKDFTPEELYAAVWGRAALGDTRPSARTYTACARSCGSTTTVRCSCR